MQASGPAYPSKDAEGWEGVFSACSHLALWPGLYVMACTWFVAQFLALTSTQLWTALPFAFLTGVGVYLVDRAKLRNEWLDPADADANPPRFVFVARRAPGVRLLAACLLAAACLLGNSGFVDGRWAGMPLLALAGVVCYAARPRQGSPRPKDLLFLKNAYVALGIAGFSFLVVLAASGSTQAPLERPLVWSVVFMALALRVLVDAALCDLDDRAADERHGTHTLPVRLGGLRALDAATVTHLILAVFMALAPVGPASLRLTWAVAFACSAVALRLASPRRVRDIVDIRFVVECLAVSLIVGVI